MSIKENLRRVRERIAQAARKVGRDPAAIKLVAVIKNVPLGSVWEALEAGVTDLGESRVQAAAERYQAIRARYPGVALHLLGHLQRNKVRQALDIFAIIQSVDSERLAAELAQRAVRPVPILIEVNSSGEPSKFGVEPERTLELVRFAASFDKLKVQGLMTIGPLAGSEAEVRGCFRRLRELAAGINVPAAEMKYLSMGMTDDFELAVEEGSNLVRIGRAIFAA